MTPLKKEKAKRHLFYGLWGSHFSTFSTVCIRWRYKGYLLELPFCWITGMGCWIGFCRCGYSCSLITVGSFSAFPWEEQDIIYWDMPS